MQQPQTKEFIWCPTNFDPGNILPDDLKRYGDYAIFLLHIIESRRFEERRNRDVPFVNLKYDYLAPFFPSRKILSQIKDCLIKNGIIETDNQFIVGKKCFGYKLSDAFDVRPEMKSVTDKTLVEKVRKFRRARVVIETPIHQHLYDCLLKVEIEGESDEIPDTLIRQFASIRYKDYFFKPDEYGRVHTNITNLSKELRNRLRVDGGRLVNLDIKNSQPLVFAALLVDNRVDSPDAHLFSERCQQGIFYDHLMPLLNIPPDAKSRKAFKKEFFRDVFYGRNKSTTENWKVFKGQYPTVADYIWQYKKGRKDEYKKLARDLQKLESDIIIGGIIKSCMEQRADIWVSTIHDSILTTPGFVDVIKEIVQDNFSKIGLIPKIDEEIL